MGTRVFTVEDMAKVRCLHDLQVSADERLIAFVEDWSDEGDGKWRSRVIVRCGEAEHALENAQHPRFSPDGAQLYYLLAGRDGLQLHCLATDKLGQAELARQVIHLRHGMQGFSLSEDGGRMVFSCCLWPEERDAGLGFAAMTEEEREEFAYQREWGPQEITQIDYKHDSCMGVRDGSIATLGLMETATGAARLIECAYPLSHPALSPDGGRIACYAQPHTGAKWSRQELMTVEADGRTALLTDGALLTADAAPQFTADGEQIVYPGWYVQGGCTVEALFRIPAQGGEAVCLFDPERDTVSSGVNGAPISRTEHGQRRSFFTLREDSVDFLCAFDGRERLYTLPLTGKQIPVQVLGGEYSVHEYVRLRDGGMYVLRGDDETFSELYRVDGEGRFARLRDSNPWLRDVTLGRTVIRAVKSRDGKAVIRSRVTMPAQETQTAAYPVVLYLHGGPDTCYSTDLWHEVQILAGRGYMVVCCDPRGSAGYGLAFSDDDLSWSDEAYEDMMDCLEDAAALGADLNRAGVTGGSYGGYMTCKIIMRTDRFRAACAQRTFVNKATSYGTGDIGFYSARMKPEDVVVRDCLLQRSRTSIIRDIDRVKTPLLLLHGYRDYRCSFEQSEQMFIALRERRREVPVRLVMFPEENHEVGRSGLLGHRQAHVREMCDWFDRFLKEVQA